MIAPGLLLKRAVPFALASILVHGRSGLASFNDAAVANPRVQALGASVNEVWFAMAMQFYSSAEYAAFNRNNSDFVTDLYVTFFNRAPDTAGFNDWTTKLSQGMPREVVLASFMFSPEFAAFTQALFGNAAVRPEIDTVADFYRGFLGRLPDDGGFAYWKGGCSHSSPYLTSYLLHVAKSVKELIEDPQRLILDV